MTPTRRIIIAIPIVTGPGSPNPELCDFGCPGLEALIRPARCSLFPTRGGRWRSLKVTDRDGYPTRCRQCREAEVE